LTSNIRIGSNNIITDSNKNFNVKIKPKMAIKKERRPPIIRDFAFNNELITVRYILETKNWGKIRGIVMIRLFDFNTKLLSI
jgi:hypothetical protein